MKYNYKLLFVNNLCLKEIAKREASSNQAEVVVFGEGGISKEDDELVLAEEEHLLPGES